MKERRDIEVRERHWDVMLRTLGNQLNPQSFSVSQTYPYELRDTLRILCNGRDNLCCGAYVEALEDLLGTVVDSHSHPLPTTTTF